MKLKYYLRGLGIGILITTIIFIIGIHVNQDQMFSTLDLCMIDLYKHWEWSWMRRMERRSMN